LEQGWYRIVFDILLEGKTKVRKHTVVATVYLIVVIIHFVFTSLTTATLGMKALGFELKQWASFSVAAASKRLSQEFSCQKTVAG
jgi:hypothetical protein